MCVSLIFWAVWIFTRCSMFLILEHCSSDNQALDLNNQFIFINLWLYSSKFMGLICTFIFIFKCGSNPLLYWSTDPSITNTFNVIHDFNSQLWNFSLENKTKWFLKVSLRCLSWPEAGERTETVSGSRWGVGWWKGWVHHLPAAWIIRYQSLRCVCGNRDISLQSWSGYSC